jgi:PTH1 family peptidyl-tRNA hydrolase
MTTPFLFLALGNPGDQYARSRHNAGWQMLDALIDRWHNDVVPLRWQMEKKIQAEVCHFHQFGLDMIGVKPQTFMNESGQSALAACKWFLDYDVERRPTELRNVMVIHDDLDLELGTYKLQFASGPKQHNGLNSVRNALAPTNFWVARIGIDARAGDRSLPGQAYVLQPFTNDEQTILHRVAMTLAEEIQYVVLQ